MSLLAADGIETRPAFYSLHQLPPYKSDGSDLVRSEQWAASGISLPTHAALSEDDVEYVCARVIFHLTNFGNRSVGACSDQSMHASTLQLPEQASTARLPEQASTARLPEQASTARLPDQAVESVEKITGKKYAEVISCQ
jgi:hypothetical protein